MNAGAVRDFCSSLLAHIAEPAIRSLVLGCFAAAALAVFRVKNAGTRLGVWKTVLCVALAMPLLGWLLPPISIQVPQLVAFRPKPVTYRLSSPAPVVVRTFQIAQSHQAGTAAEYGISEETHDSPVPSDVVAKRAQLSISWPIVITATYVAVVLFFLARLLLGITLTRRLAGSATPLSNPRLDTASPLSSNSFVFIAKPRFGESARISAPMTIGVWSPMILLPPDWREWDDQKRTAILVHELSHCARRDALMQHLSLLHRAVFWFSPLAWWLDRHIAELAEQASDDAALAGGVDRSTYAATLLDFFAALQAAPGRVWWQGLSLAKPGTAERRLDRILAGKGAGPMNLKKSLVIAAVSVAAPMIFLVSSVRPVASQESPALAATAQPAQPLIPATLAFSPEPPIPPQQAATKHDDAKGENASKGTIVVQSGAGTHGKILRRNGSTCSVSGVSFDEGLLVVAGDTCLATDTAPGELPPLQAKITDHAIQFDKDGKPYVIHDQATVDRARSFFAPMFDLGRQQEELGKKQSELGEKQEALGDEMSDVKVDIPDMTAEFKAIEAKMADLRAKGGTQADVGELQAELGELQGRLGEIQGRAGEQQGRIGERQGRLGEEMGRLGEMQGKLGEMEDKISKHAVHDLKTLLDDAVVHNLAAPE